MHIGILGAGSIGCYLGGCLTAVGYPVTFIGRERVANDIKNTGGIKLTDWRGRDTFVPQQSFSYSLSPIPLQQADVILVTVKSGDTTDVAKLIADHAQPETVIISFQNGVGNGKLLEKALPNYTILMGMVPFNVVNKGLGHFHCGTEGNLALQSLDGVETPLVNALRTAKLDTNTYNDMQPVVWGKLVMNLNNAINALSGIPLFVQLQDKGYRTVLAASIKEALKVLKVAGIQPARTGKVIPSLLPGILALPNWLFVKVANTLLKIDPEAISSMALDLALNRTTEIDFFNGEIVALAEKHNTPAPINQKITQLIKKAEQNQQGSPGFSANDLIQNVLPF